MCRTRRDVDELVRAGRDGSGRWYLGRGTGRGAWWCGDAKCGDEVRSGHLSRALRKAVNEDDVRALRIVWKASKSTKL